MRVYTTEDHKLWFTIDNSLNLHEAETQHPKTAKHDMQEVVRPFFNDMRDHYLATGEALTMTGLLKINEGILKGQKAFADNIDTHISAIQNLGKGVTEMVAKIDEFSRIIKQFKR